MEIFYCFLYEILSHFLIHCLSAPCSRVSNFGHADMNCSSASVRTKRLEGFASKYTEFNRQWYFFLWSVILINILALKVHVQNSNLRILSKFRGGF